jgi:hypothetical protein
LIHASGNNVNSKQIDEFVKIKTYDLCGHAYVKQSAAIEILTKFNTKKANNILKLIEKGNQKDKSQNKSITFCDNIFVYANNNFHYIIAQESVYRKMKDVLYIRAKEVA